MSTNSTIEWTDITWNPTTGCDRISAGCDNCYALKLAKRLKAMELQRIELGKLDSAKAKYQRDGDPRTSGPGFGVTEHPQVLLEPFTWRKPRRVFVNSMSDLFHAEVSSDFIASVWAVMALTPQHTYQVLTKRPRRSRNVLTHAGHAEAVCDEMLSIAVGDLENGDLLDTAHNPQDGPLPNVWLGVSTEDQRRAAERIPVLLDTPAAVRWISAEPLLGPVNITEWLHDSNCVITAEDVCICSAPREVALDWVVAGGESGVGARPLDLDWIRVLRDQCTEAGVPFLFKQVGGRTSKTGGRELDGRTWDEYPVLTAGRAT